MTPISGVPAVPQAHRVPAHLARRFHQICLGVTAEVLERETLTPIEYQECLPRLTIAPDRISAGLPPNWGSMPQA